METGFINAWVGKGMDHEGSRRQPQVCQSQRGWVMRRIAYKHRTKNAALLQMLLQNSRRQLQNLTPRAGPLSMSTAEVVLGPAFQMRKPSSYSQRGGGQGCFSENSEKVTEASLWPCGETQSLEVLLKRGLHFTDSGTRCKVLNRGMCTSRLLEKYTHGSRKNEELQARDRAEEADPWSWPRRQIRKARRHTENWTESRHVPWGSSSPGLGFVQAILLQRLQGPSPSQGRGTLTHSAACNQEPKEWGQHGLLMRVRLMICIWFCWDPRGLCYVERKCTCDQPR